ncbi:hypothetical protein DTO166G4_7785 [Paecilomyces variotii]|nr:hypothetical protein DTO166G4_7785 [Paecilomyces variotii]KAJ9236191.1 hypothetical protein DTO166G5_4236 [Paecilomyces variotii]KAJ9249978.1 hypothetical protein DTO195F2_8293 [Paecilomyces variotii]KAJ9286397.1 hypothetical protein DTO021C3_5931 [Paecilomyces variotii]KAJ9357673.1 hypothetical protein DTO280E4_5439 [Paecilomyces variotii]
MLHSADYHWNDLQRQTISLLLIPKARALIVILSVVSPATWSLHIVQTVLSLRAFPPEAVSRPSEVPPAATNEALQVVDYAA